MRFDPAAKTMKEGIFSVLPEVFICRCTGCQSIVASALDAAARLRSERTA